MIQQLCDTIHPHIHWLLSICLISCVKKRGAAVRNFRQKIDAANGRYVAWKTWDLICQPKKNGGLAIKDLWKKKLRLCFWESSAEVLPIQNKEEVMELRRCTLFT